MLLEQLSELLSSREPSAALSETALAAHVRQQLAGPAWAYGVRAHYPWDERLVHVLPEREFFELRTDRNRHKITSAEQRRLRELRIGVIGLSAGQSIAITLAQEGIGSLYRLADFDRLTLSNTNRVRARVHELGLPKPVMTARAIAEIDPYVKVEIFPAGFGRENAQAFFEGDSVERGGERLDFLIEVCDSIDVKALARVEARERRVPVLMVNSEGGILDIERFDLEPDRPIFHGLAPADIDPLALAGADLDTKVAYLLPIVGLDNLSDRMVASLVEAGSTVSTWPQLRIRRDARGRARIERGAPHRSRRAARLRALRGLAGCIGRRRQGRARGHAPGRAPGRLPERGIRAIAASRARRARGRSDLPLPNPLPRERETTRGRRPRRPAGHRRGGSGRAERRQRPTLPFRDRRPLSRDPPAAGRRGSCV